MTIGTLQKLLKYGYKVTVIDDVINNKNSLKSYGNPLLYISNHDAEVFISAVMPQLATAKLNGRTAPIKKLKQSKLIQKFIDTPVKYRNYKTYNGNPDAQNSLLHLKKPNFINKKNNNKSVKHTSNNKSYTIKNKNSKKSRKINKPKHNNKPKDKPPKKNSYLTLNEFVKKLVPFKCEVSVMKNNHIYDDNGLLGEYAITVTNLDYDIDISSIATNYFVPVSNGVNNQKVLDLIYKFAKTPIKYRDYKHFNGIDTDGNFENKQLVKSVRDNDKALKDFFENNTSNQTASKDAKNNHKLTKKQKLLIPEAKTISFQLTPHERKHLAKRRMSGNFGKTDAETLHMLIALDIQQTKN